MQNILRGTLARRGMVKTMVMRIASKGATGSATARKSGISRTRSPSLALKLAGPFGRRGRSSKLAGSLGARGIATTALRGVAGARRRRLWGGCCQWSRQLGRVD
eukprot:5313779-Alexandrium_andersonii.AAC.1